MLEAKLATAQRANKKDRVKAIHARIANRRKDFHHKLSTKLVQGYGAIFIGNVNASALANGNSRHSFARLRREGSSGFTTSRKE